MLLLLCAVAASNTEAPTLMHCYCYFTFSLLVLVLKDFEGGVMCRSTYNLGLRQLWLMAFVALLISQWLCNS